MEINVPRGGSFRPSVPDFRKWAWPIAVVMILFSTVSSMVYKVDPEEVGVIQLFGKYVRTELPGLHFKMPYGIETLRLVKTKRIQTEEFGFQTLRPGVRTEYAESFVANSRASRRSEEMRFQKQIGFPANSFLHESMMLTGDLNLAVVEWIVQYRHADPYKFLFKVREPDETLRNLSEAVMRQVVGDRTVDEVITLSRTDIQQEAKIALQEALNNLDSGIEISQVVLQNVNPPDEVKPSFNDVNTARQDKERTINQAWQEYNKTVPKAKGDAERIIREAEGYALMRVNSAEGDAQKFTEVWNEYKGAQDITRRRMYLETMSEVYAKVPHKVIVDENLKSILPLMNLNELASAAAKSEGGNP